MFPVSTQTDTVTVRVKDNENNEDSRSDTSTVTVAPSGKIIVKKVTEPSPDPTSTSFTFTGDAAGSIKDGETIEVQLNPGTYTSTEVAAAGFVLTSITCDDSNSTGNVETATATFNLEAGETVTCTFTNTKKMMSKVTDSSLCEFDVDPADGDQFRLSYVQDKAASKTYRLNSSNPGQFYYNVFYAGVPGEEAHLTIQIPYPFVTQGAVPIHVYSDYGLNADAVLLALR